MASETIHRAVRNGIGTALLMLALVLSAMAFAPGMAAEAFADDVPNYIGTVHVGDTNFNATSYKELREELAKHKGKQVTVDMLCDWDARTTAAAGTALEKAKPDARLVIPAGAQVGA